MLVAMSDVVVIAEEASPLDADEQAADPAEVIAAWRGVDRNSRTLSAVGLGASILGPPVMLVGFGLTISNALSGDGGGFSVGTGLLLGGLAGTLAGSPVLAAGGLRSRKAIGVQSGTWSSGSAGYATWGLWGASFGLVSTALAMQNGGKGDVASALAIAGTLAYGGAVISGVVQLRTNADARLDLAVTFSPTPNGVAIQVAF